MTSSVTARNPAVSASVQFEVKTSVEFDSLIVAVFERISLEYN